MFVPSESGRTKFKLDGFPAAENGRLIGGAAAEIEMRRARFRATKNAFRVLIVARFFGRSSVKRFKSLCCGSRGFVLRTNSLNSRLNCM